LSIEWIRRIGLGIVLAGALAGFAGAGSTPSFAQSLEQQIDSALKSEAKPNLTRGLGLTRPPSDPKAADDQRFIDRLRTRAIVVEPTQPGAAEDRAKIAEIVRDKPRIDLEIYFDYDSAVVGPKALPALIALGTVLSKPDYASTIFFINGYTDAKGAADYNLGLSQRRADAVRRVLIEQFKLPPDTLISTGFGKEQLKIPEQPYADQNRRVQIVNTEQKATAGR
jgi:outer membrane protein OmpA-like peptidoglycan-associated protein